MKKYFIKVAQNMSYAKFLLISHITNMTISVRDVNNDLLNFNQASSVSN